MSAHTAPFVSKSSVTGKRVKAVPSTTTSACTLQLPLHSTLRLAGWQVASQLVLSYRVHNAHIKREGKHLM